MTREEITSPNASHPPTPECPDCQSLNFVTVERQQAFRYGRGESAVDVSCGVPIYMCSRCGCEWSGAAAEEIRHEALCRRLGRLTPCEIIAIREASRLSQAEFSRITG